MNIETKTKHFTMRIALGVVMCDPRTNTLHTGSWSQSRHGTRGRFPKKATFNTDCGQQLEVVFHTCDHNFTECVNCKTKNSQPKPQ